LDSGFQKVWICCVLRCSVSGDSVIGFADGAYASTLIKAPPTADQGCYGYDNLTTG